MPTKDWDALDQTKSIADLAKFDRRINEIITTLNWKLALLANETDSTKIAERNAIAADIQSLKEVRELTHKLVDSLQRASKSQDETEKKSFNEGFNQVVDRLLKLDAFQKDQRLQPMTGTTALWSKLNQTFASDVAKEKKGVTLESSLAGYLFDGLAWGTKWSTDPDAPMKQFWMRMSIEIARAASNSPTKSVDLYVLEQVVKESAFFTDEWPRIKESIEKGDLEALYLYKFELAENKKERNIFLLNELPDMKELQQQKFEKSYIFIKEPPTLYFVQNGNIEALKLSEGNDNDKQRVQKYIDILLKTNTSNDPLDKKSDAAMNAMYMISRNPEHRMWHTLKTTAPVAIKTQEQLDTEIKAQNPDYKKYQQQWQNLQAAKGKSRKWAESVVRMNRAGQLESAYEKSDASRTTTPRLLQSMGQSLDDLKKQFDQSRENEAKAASTANAAAQPKSATPVAVPDHAVVKPPLAIPAAVSVQKGEANASDQSNKNQGNQQENQDRGNQPSKKIR